MPRPDATGAPRARTMAAILILGLVSCALVSCASAASVREEPAGARPGQPEASVGQIDTADRLEAKQVLTNDDILDMVRKDVEDDVIIELIGASEAKFDVSMAGMLNLSRNGVSEAIIRAMAAAMGGA